MMDAHTPVREGGGQSFMCMLYSSIIIEWITTSVWLDKNNTTPLDCTQYHGGVYLAVSVGGAVTTVSFL